MIRKTFFTAAIGVGLLMIGLSAASPVVATPSAPAVIAYDIVYVRQPRNGDTQHMIWPEVFHPGTLEPGSDLILLHPNGTEEVLIDTGVPGVVTGTPKLSDYGTFAVDNMEVLPDASGNSNIVGAQQVALALYYVDELAGGSVGQPGRRARQGHRSGDGRLHGESGHDAGVQGGRLPGVQRRGERPG